MPYYAITRRKKAYMRTCVRLLPLDRVDDASRRSRRDVLCLGNVLMCVCSAYNQLLLIADSEVHITLYCMRSPIPSFFPPSDAFLLLVNGIIMLPHPCSWQITLPTIRMRVNATEMDGSRTRTSLSWLRNDDELEKLSSQHVNHITFSKTRNKKNTRRVLETRQDASRIISAEMNYEARPQPRINGGRTTAPSERASAVSQQPALQRKKK